MVNPNLAQPHFRNDDKHAAFHDLNVMVTLTCNAECHHCSVESSPRVKLKMDDSVVQGVLSLIPKFGQLPASSASC